MDKQIVHNGEGSLRSNTTRDTLISELKLCSTTKNLQRGRELHAEALASGNHRCIYVANSILNMYAKCGRMAEARELFDSIKNPDVVSWNTLILGYAENRESDVALDLFYNIRRMPNRITFIAAIKACTFLSEDKGRQQECLQLGKQIHLKIKCTSDIHIQNTLINMYANCGSMFDAQEVFGSMKCPDVVSWTALISGYTTNGEASKALDMFARMKSQGTAPDNFTYVAALKACSSLAQDEVGIGKSECLQRGRKVHSQISSHIDVFVQNTLIDMYAKCGCMRLAQKSFDSIQYPTVVSWNAIILGYADNGKESTALDLYSTMKSRGFVPNSRTFLAALKACGCLGAMEMGKTILAQMHIENTIMLNCVVDFCTKCGCIGDAQNVFDLHAHNRDLTTWTIMLSGYSRLGDNRAVELFEEMQDAGFQPNRVTFLCILTFCTYAGLFEECMSYFENIPKLYKLCPTVEHYTCVVDLLGRWNKLDKAIVLLQSMPCRSDAVIWMTVLGACRRWKNIGVGSLAFRSFLCFDSTYSAVYVVMAHIYGNKGMMEEKRICLFKSRELKWEKHGESSWTSEFNGVTRVHTFVQRSSNHLPRYKF